MPPLSPSRGGPVKAIGPTSFGLWPLGALLLAVFLCASPVRAAPLAASLDEAEALMAGGQAEAALRLLDPLERQGAGDVRYDYLLAIASLDSGGPERAVAVFDRILSYAPRLAGIRVELAQALARMGNLHRARQESRAVLETTDLPGEVRAAAQDLSAALAYAELAPASPSAPVEDGAAASPPVLLSVDALAPQPAGGMGEAIFTDGISARATLRGGLDSLSWHAGAGTTTLRQGDGQLVSYDGQAGLELEDGDMRLGLALRAGLFVQNGSRAADSHGLSVYWRYQPSPRAQLTMTASLDRRTHADPKAIGWGAETRGWAAAWSFADEARRNQLVLRLAVDRLAVEGRSPEQPADLTTLSARWQARVNDRLGMASTLYVQHRMPRHSGIKDASRAGVALEAGIGLDCRLARAWSLNPTLAWSSAETPGVSGARSEAEVSLWLKGVF